MSGFCNGSKTGLGCNIYFFNPGRTSWVGLIFLIMNVLKYYFTQYNITIIIEKFDWSDLGLCLHTNTIMQLLTRLTYS